MSKFIAILVISLTAAACVPQYKSRLEPDPQANYVVVENKTTADSIRVSACDIRRSTMNSVVDTLTVQIHYRICGPNAVFHAEAYKYGQKWSISANRTFGTAYQYLLDRSDYNYRYGSNRQMGDVQIWTLTDDMFGMNRRGAQ